MFKIRKIFLWRIAARGKMTLKKKVRKARLDADRKAKPLTRIVVRVPANQRYMTGREDSYEIQDTDPNPLTEGPKKT